MRDAFQIEYGGPATDKAKQLYNRTDGLVLFIHQVYLCIEV